MTSVEAHLHELSSLLAQRNRIDDAIAKLIGRPATTGHIGEFIAALVFGIELYSSAAHKGADGTFSEGPLRGKTVNIKLYGKQEGIIDINEGAPPDFFLVLTGPRSDACSSRGQRRPLVIEYAYLFSGEALVAILRARGTKVGIASSLPKVEWERAEIWPTPRNSLLQLNPVQSAALGMFRSDAGAES